VSSILVIGYGNELRRDDALGPKVAGILESRRRPGLRVIICHQLTPELADPISSADAVIFIDAAVGTTEVRVQPLKAGSFPKPSGHTSDPRTLLGLAQALFGRSPPAWWMTAPAFDTGFGESLSEPAQAHLRAALKAFDRLWSEWACGEENRQKKS
jgi:hydrogenase maturation protease